MIFPQSVPPSTSARGAADGRIAAINSMNVTASGLTIRSLPGVLARRNERWLLRGASRAAACAMLRCRARSCTVPRCMTQISAVLLTYNCASFVREAIRSVFGQDWAEPLEVIVSDDASTDGTYEIVCDEASAYRGP